MKFDSIIQLVQQLNTEEKAIQYWASCRWADGVVSCGHCGNEKYYVFKNSNQYKCAGCKKQFNAKTNTILQDTKLPTLTWLVAMWVITHKKGISSVELSKEINVTQDTAWHMLQKIRIAMSHENIERLSGTVEIDETFVGGKSQFKHKNKRAKYLKENGDLRGWTDKIPVMGLIERGGKIKAGVVPSVKAEVMYAVVTQSVEKGSVLMTDGYQGYVGFESLYDTRKVDHGKGIYCVGENHTNTIENFWSQMKKGLKSTYHRNTRKHLNNYVQEFVFKYNYRNLTRQQQIERLLWNSQIRVTHKQIISAA